MQSLHIKGVIYMDEFGCDYECRTVGESIIKYNIPNDWCAEFDQGLIPNNKLATLPDGEFYEALGLTSRGDFHGRQVAASILLGKAS